MMKPKQKKQMQRRLKARTIRASAPNDGVIEISCSSPVEFEAIEASDDNPNPLARASMLAYTGAPMKPGGWTQAEPVVVDLAGMALPKSGRLPLHRDHDTSQVVGHSESISADGGQLNVTGVISATNAHATEVVGSSKNGFPWQASIGAKITATPEFVQAGQSKRVNGRNVKGPIYIARKSRLREVSFVSLGADGDTSAVAASDNQGIPDMDPKFKEWLEAKGFDAEAVGDNGFLKSQFDAEVAAEEQPEEIEVAAAPASSDAPVSDLIKATAGVHRRNAFYEKELAGNSELIAQAIECQWDDAMVKAQKELVELRAGYSSGPAIHAGASSQALTQGDIECAMHKHINGNADGYDEKQVERVEKLQASGHMPRQAGLQFLFHEVLRASGKSVHPKTIIDGDLIVEAKFASSRFGSQISAASGFSTISLPNILSNLMHKRMLDAYQSVDSVFRQFCRTSSVSDFKDHNKLRIHGVEDLETLGATGEIKHTDLDEEAYKISVDTKARMISLTRKMIRNDDMDALMRIPTFFGIAGARTLEKSVFTELLANTNTFFNAAATPNAQGYAGNALAAGAASALGAPAIKEMKKLFRKQQDKRGNPVMMSPSMVLAPVELEDDLDNLLGKETQVVAGDPTTGTQLRIANQYKGEFTPITTPWLDTSSGLTNSSDTGFYLLAKPGAGALMEVAFLDGRQTPIIESDETDFNTLGVQWRAYFDWGVAFEDGHYGVYSPGA